MRTLTTLLLCAAASYTMGQTPWQSLFRADPELSDGYFIVDKDKADSLRLSRIEVDIIAAEIQPNGQTVTSVIETLVIDDGFFAQADFTLWDELEDPFRILYHARGYNVNDDIVIDVQAWCDGCGGGEEVCRETCESNLYAYTLVAYSNGALATIDLHEGTVNGSYTRLYVKASDWQTFQNMFTPGHFGIGGGTWSNVLLLGNQGVAPYATDVIRLQYPYQTPPPGARDYQGFLLGPVAQDVYAVKKGKGPWVGFYAHTDEMAAQALVGCPSGHLRTLYNADALVQNALATYNLDPLACMGMMVTGGGLSWGSGYNSWCTEYHIDEQTWGDPPNYLGGVTMSVIGCVHLTHGYEPSGTPTPSGSGPGGTYTLADVANIIVSHWTDNSRTGVLSVPVKGIGDPRLLKVTKTEVPAGLYEFMVIMNDGRIMTRFIDFASPTILNADFAAFTHINIYPVPVREQRFAIDMDTPVPMSLNLTIVNNMGVPYYTKALSFSLPGLNKHVVVMGTPWPDGLYHAIFQYADGSSESHSFTVGN